MLKGALLCLACCGLFHLVGLPHHWACALAAYLVCKG